MDIGTFIGLLGAVGGLIGAVVSVRVARASAKKDEVEALRGIIAELRERVQEVEAQYDDLCEWVRGLGYDPIRRRPLTEPLDDLDESGRGGDAPWLTTSSRS